MTQAIIHPTDLYYIEFRQDYLLICHSCAYTKNKNGKKSKASPHCKALMLAVLERWMSCKKEGEPVYLSISKWTEALYGMYGRNVIIDSLDELAGEGLIFRRGCKTRGGEMYGYLLNTDELNSRLSGLKVNQLTSKPVDETDESGLLINQKRFTNQPLSAESGLKVNRKRFKSKHIIDYTDTSNIDTTQKEESVTASASHIPTLDSSSQENSHEETSEAEPAVPSQSTHPIATGKPATQDDQMNKVASQATAQHFVPPVEPSFDQWQDTPPAPVSPGKKRVRKPAPAKEHQAPAGLPTMPADDAPWNAEIAVQLVEAKLGKRYREAARIKEINAAKKMLRDDPELSREDFTRAYDERNDAWWHEHVGLLHLHYMVEKDRIHSMLELIDARALRAAKPGRPSEYSGKANLRIISSFDDPNYDMSDEFYPDETTKKALWAARAAVAVTN